MSQTAITAALVGIAARIFAVTFISLAPYRSISRFFRLITNASALWYAECSSILHSAASLLVDFYKTVEEIFL